MPGPEELPLGCVLNGHYQVVEAIARGGIATVYSAVDQRLRRAVALKVVRVADATEHERQGFLRGAEAAAGLQHPNVLQVHDFGADEALGVVYVVMELLEGEDVASRTARAGPLAAEAALAVVSQAARGLAVGHQAGMVHGGVKPENLFLAQDARGEVRVRVLDFGMAEAAFSEPALATDASGPLPSTFAAPEVRNGMPATAAADVFSLAATAIFLLTGQRPFTGEATLQPVEVDAALNRLVGIPGVTPGLRDVLRRALTADPHRRWTDADAFRQALHAARGTGEDALTVSSLASTPSSSAPRAPGERVPLAAAADADGRHTSAAYEPAAPPVRRTPAAPAGAPPPRKAFRAALPVILATLAAVAALTFLRPEPYAPDQAAAPAESATDDPPPWLGTGDSLERRPDSLSGEALAGAVPAPESGTGTPPKESLYELPEVEQLPRPLNRMEVTRWIQRNYPPELRDAGVHGNLQLRFVVDTAGRVESGSIEVTVRSHPEFERVAIRAVEQTRFSPAMVGQRPVRVRVEQPFVFQSYP
ncbi:MAG TPA: TonB family protein [Longimicrobium sp.]|nr:TonB family protein [Longimicrobium sp.]